MKKILFIIVIALAWRHFYYIPEAPKLGPGIKAQAAPFQETTSEEPFVFDKYTIKPKANFSIEAKILSAERYYLDVESRLSPIDFALGWGPMSDESVLEQIEISQGGRWYKWQSQNLPISKKLVETNSANMHMIPANSQIEADLKRIKIGEIVAIEGMLVNITNGTGWQWKSSMSRTDTGAGACEVVYVTEIRVVTPYE